MKPRVIDLSHHNSIPIDLKEAAAAGIVGVIHKATEGTTYVDSKVQARCFLADDAGLAWGLYHFLRPGDMRAQADFFVSTAEQLDILDGETLLAADHEDSRVSFTDLLEFLAAVEEMAGRSPVIYSGHVLKEQCQSYPNQYRLWLAQYSAAPTLPAGCERYYLWQYSDKGTVPGIDPPTDVNTFEGSDADFLAAWSGRPSPVDDMPEIEITISADRPVRVVLKFGENANA